MTTNAKPSSLFEPSCKALILFDSHPLFKRSHPIPEAIDFIDYLGVATQPGVYTYPPPREGGG